MIEKISHITFASLYNEFMCVKIATTANRGKNTRHRIKTLTIFKKLTNYKIVAC